MANPYPHLHPLISTPHVLSSSFLAPHFLVSHQVWNSDGRIHPVDRSSAAPVEPLHPVPMASEECPARVVERLPAAPVATGWEIQARQASAVTGFPTFWWKKDALLILRFFDQVEK